MRWACPGHPSPRQARAGVFLIGVRGRPCCAAGFCQADAAAEEVRHLLPAGGEQAPVEVLPLARRHRDLAEEALAEELPWLPVEERPTCVQELLADVPVPRPALLVPVAAISPRGAPPPKRGPTRGLCGPFGGDGPTIGLRADGYNESCFVMQDSSSASIEALAGEGVGAVLPPPLDRQPQLPQVYRPLLAQLVP